MRNGDSIPWQYAELADESNLGAVAIRTWSWETPHFTASVIADASPAVRWLVESRLSGPLTLGDGYASSFGEAEGRIKEIIGKALPVELGYQQYAGRYATMFTLQTGEQVDVSQFLHQRCLVTVLTSLGTQRTFHGTLETRHWEIVVRGASGGRTALQPGHVVKILPEYGAADATSAWTGMGRLYRGKPTGVCTGSFGFMPDTVDHDGPPCPQHELGSTSASR